jgi:hypothetical protein
VGVVLAQEEEGHNFLVSQGKKYNDMILFFSFLFCVFCRYLRVSSLVALPSWVWMKKSKYCIAHGFGPAFVHRMLLSIAKRAFQSLTPAIDWSIA